MVRQERVWRHKNMRISIKWAKGSESGDALTNRLNNNAQSISKIKDQLLNNDIPLSIQDTADLLCEVNQAILAIRQVTHQVVHSGLDSEDAAEIILFAAGLLTPTLKLKKALKEKLDEDLSAADACLSEAMGVEDTEADDGEDINAGAEKETGGDELATEYIDDLIDLLERYDLLSGTDSISIEVFPAADANQCHSIEVSAYVDGAKLEEPAIIPDAEFLTDLYAILDKSGVLEFPSGVQIIIGKVNGKE